MKKGITPIRILVAILLVGIIGFGIYQSSTRTSFSPTTVTPIASQTPDITLLWDTYTNSKYGLEFKYPTDWKFFPLNDEALYTSLSLSSYDTTEIEKYMNHGMIDVKKFGKPLLKIEVSPLFVSYPMKYSLPQGEIEVKNETEYVQTTLKNGDSNSRLITPPSLKIDNQSTYQIDLSTPNSTFDSVTEYLVFPSNRVFTILVEYKSLNGEKIEDTGYKKTVDTILSTFKFTR